MAGNYFSKMKKMVDVLKERKLRRLHKFSQTLHKYIKHILLFANKIYFA
jgi:hypothetical protein